MRHQLKVFCKVFIVINERVLNNRNGLQKEIADLYAKVYNAPPWNEDWTQASALDELMQGLQKEGFSGVVLGDKKLIGFSWGYKVPLKSTERVDFEKIREEIRKRNLNPDKAFYGAETGIDFDYRKKGLATKLLEERSKKNEECDVLCFRTKNPLMLKIYNRAFGKEDFSFPEETSYNGGRVYVFKVRES